MELLSGHEKIITRSVISLNPGTLNWGFTVPTTHQNPDHQSPPSCKTENSTGRYMAYNTRIQRLTCHSSYTRHTHFIIWLQEAQGCLRGIVCSEYNICPPPSHLRFAGGPKNYGMGHYGYETVHVCTQISVLRITHDQNVSYPYLTKIRALSTIDNFLIYSILTL